VRVATSTAAERSLTLRYIRPGQWFGDLPVFGSDAHTHDAFAQGPTHVGELAGADVCALMDRYPDFHRSLLAWQSMRLTSVFGLLEDHATLNLRERLARQLHRLARDHGVSEGEGEIRIGLALPQAELADLVGCSRQRLNLHIRALARQGLVRYERDKFIVPNRLALERLCGQKT
jgi:CRP/FNR family transcriptional regulator, cyclic AMP receptor protein